MKPNILYYGEGWDLWTALPGEQKASYYNAHAMPYASFFNDRFRDIAKGKSNESEIGVRGYLLGDTNYRDGFKHVLLGSAVALAFAPMFDRPVQSVNYVECHDNHTLYDKIRIACPDDNEEEVKKRIKLCTAAILIAGGIPLFHQGQEIGGSKQKMGNSYNAGDEINGFHYDLLDKNEEMYRFFQEAIKMKKRIIQLAGDEYDFLLENNRITFENLEHGALKIRYEFADCNVHMIFNPSKDSFMYEFENYVNLVFNDTGIINDCGFFMKMAIINALSFNIFYEKKVMKVSLDTKEVN
jgi:pullulanase